LFADGFLLLRGGIGTERLTASDEQLTGKTSDDLPTPFPSLLVPKFRVC
jgi:hypothetical protein